MKRVELSEDQAPDTATEESSTSLAPTVLYLSTLEAAPATEEALILPVTSLWPQVRGLGTSSKPEESLWPHYTTPPGHVGRLRHRGGRGWAEATGASCIPGLPMSLQPSYSLVGTLSSKGCRCPAESGPADSP